MSNYLRILKKYGILIEDEESRTEELERIPNRKEGETFKQWKIRTFGEDIEGLRVYTPYEPAPQTRMSTLANDGGRDYLTWAFRNFRDMAEEDAKTALKEEKEEIAIRYSKVPRALLQEIIDEYKDELEDSAVEFLERYIDNNECNISTREILTDLIKTYSAVVSRCRKFIANQEVN